MKRIIWNKGIIFLLVGYMQMITIGIYSQPVNDDCLNAIDLGIVPYCQNTLFNNLGATASDIGDNNNASCFSQNPPDNDVWFIFGVDNSDEEYIISIEGTDVDKLANIQMAVYRGICSANIMAERDCAESKANKNSVSLRINNLTQGEKYYLRIGNFGGDEYEGYFHVCIKEKNVYKIDEDHFSSKCSGTLYDSGGENGNYKNNEHYIFTICPEGDVKSIAFDFDYYHLPLINGFLDNDSFPDPGLKYHMGDRINIYYGNDTSSALFLKISGNMDELFLDDFMYGGGVDYQSCVNNKCITLYFESDDTLTAEGFAFNWQCQEDYCENKDSFELSIEQNIDSIQLLSHLLQPQIDGKLTKIDCDPRAYGIFKNNGGLDIGISQGVLLTNGLASNAIGPNDSTNISYILNNGGDKDLDELSVILNDGIHSKSKDACVIEMDIVPMSDEISYKYVFGSEEYPEFVNSFYNDIFALLISGNDIQGIPEINNQKNMAIVPHTNDFVEINSINSSKNWQYYHSNFRGKELQYDGLIYDSLGRNHYLIASQKVTPCDTYHLKFAIADRFDTIYDSGVFIGELTDGRPQIFVEYTTGLDYLLDNCDINKAKVTFRLPFAAVRKSEYDVSIGGNAISGVDYITNIPKKIVFLKGEIEKSFEVMVITDNLNEGAENIIITLSKELKCGTGTLATVQIPIKDFLDVNIVPDVDSLSFCDKDTVILTANGTGKMYWQPVEFIDNPDSTTVICHLQDSMWVKVKSILFDSLPSQCYGLDSIFIQNINPELSLLEDSIKYVCPGTEFELSISTNIDNYKLLWSPAGKVKGETLDKSATFYADSLSFMVYVEIIGGGCYDIDSAWIDVADKRIVDIFTTHIAPYYIGDTIDVEADISPSIDDTDTFSWEIDTDYFDESSENVNVILNNEIVNIVYNVVDENGCFTTDTLIINAKLRDLLFPNAILPGDPENGIFKYYKYYNGLEIINFEIFDRWGEKVFSCDNNDCAAQGWDATYKGKPVAPGVYLFRCVAITPNGNRQEYKGSLSVLR